MGFIPDAARDLQGADLAQLFAKSLQRARLLARSPDIIAWGAEFDRIKINYARVSRVLHWYCERLTQPFLPRAHSPKAFREKFEDIEAAMQSALADLVKIAPASQLAADRLCIDYDWPTELEAHMPAIVERSAVRFESFAKRLREFLPSSQRDSNFIEHILSAHMHRGFIERHWLPYWHTRVGYLTNYTGPVQALEFDPVSESFRDSFWRVWSHSWCRRSRTFDSLLTAILTE